MFSRRSAAPIDPPERWGRLSVRDVAGMDGARALVALGGTPGGLSDREAARRRELGGANVLAASRARPLATLARQLRNPLLILLVAAAIASWMTGEITAAIIVLAIIIAGTGLGFVNEYRAERAVDALHARMRHRTTVVRDGRAQRRDVSELVPGDIVELALGDLAPADLRLLETVDLECDESVLTGEPLPARKRAEPDSAAGFAPASCVLMGSVIRRGRGRAIVVATGGRTAFGAQALALGERPPPTAFSLGLRDYSLLLVRVTLLLAVVVLAANVALGRPVLEALLFALAMAVGLTPQLLPAIVTVSLATGARRLSEHRVLVKHLMSIEDLGNIDLLLTDKTGTLTDGRITLDAALSSDGEPSDRVLALGRACTEVAWDAGRPVGGNALDLALWADAPPGERPVPTRAVRPFDHERRIASVIVAHGVGARLIAKGAPEEIMARCRGVSAAQRAVAERLFAEGRRLLAVATGPVDAEVTTIDDRRERDLELVGFLAFFDRPKEGAAEAIAELNALGVRVAVVTGDNPQVAERVCADLGLPVNGVLTGDRIDALDDRELTLLAADTTVFARVSPAQKARLVALCRAAGATVGVLGDGVNDAVALHTADVGISVDTAADVAQDAADIVLLDKDLGVLARGVGEGRRIFANTMKYVLMGTSSNFGNMLSAGGGSLALGFLPLLPAQILLNNLIYDVGELAIPTDNVDPEQLRRPSHWDTALIRRFMVTFGTVSAAFDVITFVLLLAVFHADHELFRSAWFVESLATQGLVIFVIRTRRTPFWRSRPSRALAFATLMCVGAGAVLPFTPAAGPLGFTAIPVPLLTALGGVVVIYLATVEAIKRPLLSETAPRTPPSARPSSQRTASACP
ncbi:MAG TPA: magnesium-translocating P-type ATPase, partial [Miltoncostaeaceae bacterium]|nr:magnesium-translocating P-type ATPase [Miltoncostaeaceae bacterium]